ncbi:hypothetical protein EWM64_g724 [Hericium alpestre]|uniref:Uncharacterized protein n=1 Tax=Hericium alpestre TaxID=135208 RepID=A0A4Z0AAL0_9AGAM|nr:hypothetical protein EWM64_g724 [Hericium alpestre]
MPANYGSTEDVASVASSSSAKSAKSADVEVQEVDTSDSASLVGAPVEKINPLGHEVTLTSATFLNLGQLLGSGIFSVPGVVLNSVGSVGLLLTFWLIAPVFAYREYMRAEHAARC